MINKELSKLIPGKLYKITNRLIPLSYFEDKNFNIYPLCPILRFPPAAHSFMINTEIIDKIILFLGNYTITESGFFYSKNQITKSNSHWNKILIDDQICLISKHRILAPII